MVLPRQEAVGGQVSGHGVDAEVAEAPVVAEPVADLLGLEKGEVDEGDGGHHVVARRQGGEADGNVEARAGLEIDHAEAGGEEEPGGQGRGLDDQGLGAGGGQGGQKEDGEMARAEPPERPEPPGPTTAGALAGCG